jgi:hypothetical protein
MFLAALFFLFSCGSGKKLAGGTITETKKTSDLLDELDLQSSKKVDFFYSKISSKYKSSEQNFSFKTSVKLKSDSLMNAMITVANIPIMIANVSVDSVKLINKRDKCFFYTDIDYLENLLRMKISLNDAEDIILGRPVAFDRDKKYHQLMDTSFYVIATHKLKDFQNPDMDEVMIKYFLSPDSLKLEKTFISSPKDSTEILIHIKSLERIDHQDFPSEMDINAIGKKGPIEINLKYQKTLINDRKSIYFKIPDNYGECE